VIPIALIAVALSAGAAFVGGYQVAAQSYKREIAELRTEYAEANKQALEKAHAETLRLQRQADAAQRLARQRQSALAADLSANRDAIQRLSFAADSALRDANSSHSACISRAAAFSDVFAGCSKQLVVLGAETDRLASDKQTLIESWPR
jgi:uncharacterized protein HemX